MSPIPTMATFLTSFAPLSNVTPFTYRDGYTYLEALEGLKTKINDLVKTTNAIVDVVNLMSSRVDSAVALSNSVAASIDDRFTDQNAQISRDIALLKEALLSEINEANSGVCDDPTNGNRAVPVSVVMSHVYDRTRILGDFVQRHDARELTTAELDARNLTAGNYDLAPYNIIDAELTTNPRTIEIV